MTVFGVLVGETGSYFKEIALLKQLLTNANQQPPNDHLQKSGQYTAP